MRIAFRADASLQIGTGHVMRCLTLADALAARGASCHFICRAHAGNLIKFIQEKGYPAHVLLLAPVEDRGINGTHLNAPADDLSHSHWLGVTQTQDAQACAPILAQLKPDWLIVDHYALDARWERALARHYGKLMVIDDLADRQHACDLLLDQTFGREGDDYRGRVPDHCHVLCGSQYALLRPEFAALRPYSLHRRAQPQLRQLLITMGGVDKDNATGQVLAALQECALPEDCEITVVMGATAPWLSEIKQQAKAMPWPTSVRVGIKDMAQLMADSDLAIGAAGATSWERCCLGLPTVMLVLAANQAAVARGLDQAGAAQIIGQSQDIREQLPTLLVPLLNCSSRLVEMSEATRAVVDGRGIHAISEFIEEQDEGC
jgi:UDP-2,4-diacetamido-2,4,6-trideoxy-beta-L-altropyranose hydrolase